MCFAGDFLKADVSLSLSLGGEGGTATLILTLVVLRCDAMRCDAMRFAFQRQASETRDANDKVNRDDGCREIKRGSDVETVRRVGF